MFTRPRLLSFLPRFARSLYTRHNAMDKLDRFTYTETLYEDLTAKSFCLLGSVDDAPAVLIAERLPILSSAYPSFASSHLSHRQLTGNNDVFTWLTAKSHFAEDDKAMRDMKISLIHPANASQISKYRDQPRYMIRETPDIYNKVVAPWIHQLPEAKNQWVYNILDGKTEQEEILFRDNDPQTGFILIPDLKWDRRDMKTMYLQVIVQDRGIKSVRDLRDKHLPLLRHIRDTVLRVVPQHFPEVKPYQLRLFFHYQPTFYHLHVHVVHVGHTSHPGQIIGQSHLLDTVIDNIAHFDPEYYAKCQIPYTIGVLHPLYEQLKATCGDAFLTKIET